MHTRSLNKVTGKFTVTVWDWNGAECFREEFATAREADLAGQREERAMTLRMSARAEAPLTLEEILMSDDELLAALTD